MDLAGNKLMKKQDLNQASSYIGSCRDMCPEKERALRLGFQVSIFECDEHNQPSECAMVKEYRRAGADQEEPQPEDLRTPEALNLTMNYLARKLMDDDRSLSEEYALEWYDFLWDRLRAIRKDITQQNICNQDSVTLVERCTRFHVHSCYAMNRVKDFDIDMNRRNLNDCLQMLRQMYTDLRTVGTICTNESEFQKYDILLHLDQDSLSSTVQMKTSDHRSSEDMSFIVQVFNAFLNNNYYKYFQLMLKADYMTSCILGLYVNRIRLTAMKIIIAACSTRQTIAYPADLLIETLAFDDLDDLRSFCQALSIETKEVNSVQCIMLDKGLRSTLQMANLPPFKSRRLVESKKEGQLVGELVNGGVILFKNDECLMSSTGNELGKISVEQKSETCQRFVIDDLCKTDLGSYHLAPENPYGSDRSAAVTSELDSDMMACDDLANSSLETTDQLGSGGQPDAGSYSVSAENDFGVAMSRPVSLEVSESSLVEETTTTTTTTATATTTTTTTTIATLPKTSNDSTSHVNGETPAIEAARPEDDSRFLCKVKSRHGQVKSWCELPAGRFRRIKYHRPAATSCTKATPTKRSPDSLGPSEKRVRQADELAEISRRILEESQANEAFLRLYNITITGACDLNG